ncbi:MAG TPA: transcriptional regulator [Elusimicrobia bacterium]|nr:transcriptional regulator [Elusimicrobiota bacterium]HBT60394.1 transcriptional regulator [Elusimicrobiota bacterium]
MMARMALKDVELLIREGEGLAVEFKEKYTSRIDEDIVAFVNTKGGAILLGVRDDGTVAGEKLTNDLKGRINSLARNCKPAIAVEAAQVGNVVVIEIAEGPEKPYSCGSGYFRRLNGNTQKMSHEEIRIMFREHDAFPFEERTARGFSFDDVSRSKVLAFTKEAGLNIGKTATADFLRSLKVADETNVKNAGILFFAKEVHDFLPQAQMTLLAFKGTNRVHIYDRRDVRDDLFTQFKEAIHFLEKNLNVRSEIKGVNREDIYEIPLEALREAVVNAIMHRDYRITGTQVSVDIFDDRVEVSNPGGLPKGLEPKALGKGVSIRRNELVADLFARIHKVERAGTGIQRMKEAMADAGLKEPEFEANGFFRAVFRRSPELSLKGSEGGREKVVEGVVEKVVEGVVDNLTDNQRRILELVRASATISARQLAETVGISQRKIQENLARLRSKGFIKRVGPDRGGHWEVTAPSRPASGL